MAGLIAPVARLIEEFSKLPGVGTKTAQRLTYHVLRASTDDARALAAALVAIKEEVAYCSICCNITEAGVDPCDICADPRRDASRICVVEEPLDVLAIERTGEFRGRYHVLHGAISPIDGIGPERLRVRELIARVEGGSGEVQEVILATNPNLEGEATAMYLADLLGPHVAAVTRIARGLPVGGDLEYADDVTLIRSLQGRRLVER
jgi:recombination protein RecR